MDNENKEKLPAKEHDSTFKLLFENPKDIYLLVSKIINYSWANEIRESSIEIKKTNYITKEFSQVEADVVAKARLKDRDVYFYILIENQSTVAKDMPERLLRYMISIWAEEIRNGVEKLPAIIPIVVYNELDRRWEVPTDIIGAFDIFKNDIFKYKVVDIAQVDIKSYLEEEDVLTPIIFYLEQVRNDSNELIRRLQEIDQSLKKLSFNNIERFLLWSQHVIRPRLGEKQKKEYDKIVERVKQKGVELMGEFVSNVARLLDETKTKEFLAGVQQGIQQGIQQERIETAKRMIQLGISYDVISKATNLSIEEIEKIAQEKIN
ncbi:Rpn family recombination-promoting nuclease/putative transposase [Caldicellulosiruptor changbaiensis]|uniref:Rpn family recombination-promoting nuclease/putative transposase n=2 Tax=Caldicellulosiruptor TaxID=44000 RepID=A0A3T0D310_9FIRM|nr:Rpn family recombination-promoting nuclease/putative transposase [Caldicellulosiruptor changbaiensis]AZT89419.1 Rpn family recombination-promoting nuclease/putative transposase [Caldicellulosiruptor changbaiensis]